MKRPLANPMNVWFELTAFTSAPAFTRWLPVTQLTLLSNWSRVS